MRFYTTEGITETLPAFSIPQCGLFVTITTMLMTYKDLFKLYLVLAKSTFEGRYKVIWTQIWVEDLGIDLAKYPFTSGSVDIGMPFRS